MEKLDKLIERLKGFESGIIEAIADVVKQYEHTIVEMNIQDQLYDKGINKDGVKLSDANPYKPMTVRIKIEKNQPVDRVTLRDEGDFHNSFYLEYTEDGFEIKASDYKSDDLANKYGKEIFGLTDESFKEFNETYVQPELVKYFESLKI
ncbi:MAG: hypothetical protein ACRCZY_02540 [Phocaeicola sp.]